MSAIHQVSFLGKLALFAVVVSVCLLTTTSSASPIPPGFDLFTSNDELGNSLGAAVDLGALGLGIVDLKGVPFPFPPFPWERHDQPSTNSAARCMKHACPRECLFVEINRSKQQK